MNILIKLMSIVSLVIAPTLATLHASDNQVTTTSHNQVKKEFSIKVKNNGAEIEATDLIAALEKDGIIQPESDNIIDFNKGVLIINGKTIQQQEIERLHLSPDMSFLIETSNH